MPRKSRIATVILLAASVIPLFAAGQRTCHPWEVLELAMTARNALPNGYADGLPGKGAPYARAVFAGTSGEAAGKRYIIPGFWDGGQNWKVRFAPPFAGEWSYRWESADTGLQGGAGTLRCTAWSEAEKEANPTRRGFVRVAKTGPRPGRYFEYTDGTPFLWVGDTWWAWAKKGIHFSTFQKLADDRSAKGFTVGQIYFGGNGGLLDGTYSIPDLEQIRQVEKFISYANSKGITVWIHAWWTRQGIEKTIGEEKMRRWWRYVVHRLGAYNVIWTLAGEYNMNNYGGFPLQFWKDLGAMLRTEDPYQRLIGAHPTPPLWQGGAEAPQWSTGEVLHNEPWLDYNQSQPGHGRPRLEMIPRIIAADYARVPAKPVVVTEPWYEFIKGNPPAEDIRFGIWSALLSGAAGHTYGGGHIWWAHVPEAPARQGAWPLEESFETDTLDYPGAVSMSFMAKFLKSMRWWLLEPHPELVSDYAERFCAAVPGSEYLVYLRWGGALHLDLRNASAGQEFNYTWIDLTQGKEQPGGTVRGGAIRQFNAPEPYPTYPRLKDWLLHITGTPGRS